MRSAKIRSGEIIVLLSLVAFSMINCHDKATNALQTTINMQPFIAMAENDTVCAQNANKLFKIDDVMVFRQREGNCPDNGYNYTLFGKDTSTIYCRKHDGFVTVEVVNDSTYLDLFHTIIANLDDAKLGLDSSHSVIQVYF